jgi:hypothetical protein
MNLDDLLDTCYAEALSNKLAPSPEASWRNICRRYSKLFATPLHIVYSLPHEDVALALFEENLEALDPDEHLEQLLDLIYTLDDPEYAKQKEEDLAEFIADAAQQEKERLKANKPIHPALARDGANQKLGSRNERASEASLPTGGKVDLSYFEDDEGER